MIEKFAVVGEMLPAVDADIFALWLNPRDEEALGIEPGRANTIVGDPGAEEEFMDIDANASGEAPSSCIIMDILDGRVAKTDDDVLILFRLGGRKPSALSRGVSGDV